MRNIGIGQFSFKYTNIIERIEYRLFPIADPIISTTLIIMLTCSFQILQTHFGLSYRNVHQDHLPEIRTI